MMSLSWTKYTKCSVIISDLALYELKKFVLILQSLQQIGVQVYDHVVILTVKDNYDHKNSSFYSKDIVLSPYRDFLCVRWLFLPRA